MDLISPSSSEPHDWSDWNGPYDHQQSGPCGREPRGHGAWRSGPCGRDPCGSWQSGPCGCDPFSVSFLLEKEHSQKCGVVSTVSKFVLWVPECTANSCIIEQLDDEQKYEPENLEKLYSL